MSNHQTRPAPDLDLWLATVLEPSCSAPLFWAPYGWRQATDWVSVRGVEHLAVLISTASRSDNNVCFASSTRGTAERTANMIGLVGRDHLGWAVIIKHNGSEIWAGDVLHHDYVHDNYESFSALAAAEIASSWIGGGVLPGGVRYRRRS